MADHTVQAAFEADVSGLVTGMKTTQKATSESSRRIGHFGDQNKAPWDKVGQGMMVIGAAVAASFGPPSTRGVPGDQPTVHHRLASRLREELRVRPTAVAQRDLVISEPDVAGPSGPEQEALAQQFR